MAFLNLAFPHGAALTLRRNAAIASAAVAQSSNGSVYLGAKFLSQAAQNMLFIALLVSAGTQGSASVGLSSFFVAMLLPSVLLGPFAGGLVDRLGPSRAFALGATLRAAAIVPGFLLLGDANLVWVVAVIYSAASQVFTPAEFALVHHVQGRLPGRTYSAITITQYAGQAAGILVLAPLFYFFGGQAAVLVAVIAGFLGVAVAGLEMIRRRVDASRPTAASGVTVPFRTVARFLLMDGRAFYAVVALTLCGIISRVLVVSLPAYIRDEIHLGSGGALFILVPGVLGIAAGLVWASRRLTLDRAPAAMRTASLLLLAGLFTLVFVDHGVTLAAQNTMPEPVRHAEAWLNTTATVVIPASFAGGLGMILALMSARLVLTELAPAGAQGRVHAVQLAITESFLIIPVLVAGVATAMAGTRITLAVVGILAVLTLLATELRRMPAPLPVSEPLEPAPRKVQGESSPA